MNRQYVFYWRRKFFWHKKDVIGHSFKEDQNKMIMYFPDGGLQEIANWSECEVRLKSDWALAQKETISEEAGK